MPHTAALGINLELFIFILFVSVTLFSIPVYQLVKRKRKVLGISLIGFNVALILCLRFAVSSSLEGESENGSVIFGLFIVVPLMVPLLNFLIVLVYGVFNKTDDG